MQYSHINKLFKDRWLIYWPWLLKGCIFLLACLFIAEALKHKPVLAWEAFLRLLFKTNANYLLLLEVMALLPFNWILEALKWQFLVRKNEQITLSESFEGILTGVTLGFVTPNGIGDYAGRLLLLSGNNRLKNLGYLFLNRMAQLCVTLLFGGISLLYLMNVREHVPPFLLYLSAFFIGGMLVFLFMALFLNKSIVKILKKTNMLQRFYPYFAGLGKLRAAETGRICLYSTLRYLVFSFQFILLLLYFDVSIDLFQMGMGVAFIFLAKSLLPTFFEFGVREAAAVYFFSSASQTEQVLAASVSLWLINIVIPALAGLCFLPKMKFTLR